MSALVTPSTNLTSAMMTTGSLKSLVDGTIINIYGGAIPATADEAIGAATLLAQVCVTNATPAYNLSWDTPSANGVLKKPASDTWQTPTTGGIAASGTATFFRVNVSGDDNSAAISGPSDTKYRLQGNVGTDISFAMLLANPVLTAGGSIVFDTAQFRLPS